MSSSTVPPSGSNTETKTNNSESDKLKGWVVEKTSSVGDVMFVNKDTGESCWEPMSGWSEEDVRRIPGAEEWFAARESEKREDDVFARALKG